MRKLDIQQRRNYCNVFLSRPLVRTDILRQELDWYSDTRSHIYAGALARRSKSEMDWNPWYDLYVALLDNICERLLRQSCLANNIAVLVTKEEKRGGVIKRLVVSRVRKFCGLEKSAYR